MWARCRRLVVEARNPHPTGDASVPRTPSPVELRGYPPDFHEKIQPFPRRDVFISRGLKDGQSRGLKDGQSRGLKDGQTRGLKDGQTRGLKAEHTEGLKGSTREGCGETKCPHRGLKDGPTDGLKNSPRRGYGLCASTEHLKTPTAPRQDPNET